MNIATKICNVLTHCLLTLTLLTTVSEADAQRYVTCYGPHKMMMILNVDDKGSLSYSVNRGNDTLVQHSKLGLMIDGIMLDHDFVHMSDTSFCVDTTLHRPWGANKVITTSYIASSYFFRHKTTNNDLIIDIRVFDNAVAFRYRLNSPTPTELYEELTELVVNDIDKAWWSWADFDTYEKEYYHTPLDSASWAALPLVLERNDGTLLAIREANNTDYPDATLKLIDKSCYHFHLTPRHRDDKIKAFLSTPYIMPWRLISYSVDAATLVNDDVIYSLLPSPNPKAYTGKPMTYIGIWWEYHLGTKSWETGPRQGATTSEAKRYIDFAAQHNIGGVLVEGWNKGWSSWGRDHDFSYTKQSRGYNLRKVARYARDKGVRLIVHHETGGDITGYEKTMKKAFRQCRRLGIHDVKTGHAGPISTGVCHHCQDVVRHFHHVICCAADNEIALDMHEPVNGSGLEFTYPNYMTREGVRGLEWEAWSYGNSPMYDNVIPFTRGLSGPMDYTPGIFDILFDNAKDRKAWNCSEEMMNGTRVHSTIVHQLALMLTLYSPWVMAADNIDNYQDHELFAFVESLNPDYDESHMVQGSIGEYTMVRRRTNNTWYIGATTNELSRKLSMPLNFLDTDTEYEVVLYLDGEDAHWIHNPTIYRIEKHIMRHDDTLSLTLAAGGGAVAVIKPIESE